MICIECLLIVLWKGNEMGKRFKNKPKPSGSFFIRATKKNFPVDLELEFPQVYISTEGKIKSGDGITILGFDVREAWVDKEGRLICCVDPNKMMKAKKYDKYGSEVKE